MSLAHHHITLSISEVEIIGFSDRNSGVVMDRPNESSYNNIKTYADAKRGFRKRSKRKVQLVKKSVPYTQHVTRTNTSQQNV